MPGANVRQAGIAPYSSVTGWPSTANSGWPLRTTFPGAGSQVSSPPPVSLATVKTHLLHVFAKLGVHSRAELAAAAIRHGLG